jgi:flagellar M-ring protein FliF
VDTFLQALRNLGPSRLAIMGIVLFGLIGFFIFLTTRLAGPQMALLYGDLDESDSSSIIAVLNQQNVPFELRNGGKEIHVPEDRVGAVRLAVADKGLPSGGSVGYELFDDTGSLGTTDFIQNVNLVRALEGELSRTIRSIDSVKSARVHLVLPKRELFSRDRQEPSASVVLKMKGSVRLDKNQITAVQHMVAAAVPGLTPQRISIVDDKGALLARGFEDPAAPGYAAAKADERRLAYQNRLRRKIEELVEQTVGFGKVRAQVAVDMDFDRITTKEETYNPDGQVARSVQTIESTASSREQDANQSVSVATNLPDAQTQGAGAAGASSAETRTEELTNFEISKKVVNHVKETGSVKKLSISVLVDGTYVPDAEGKRSYKPRPDDEMELLATLVKGAVGYNAERGDVVEVINMPFAQDEDYVEEKLDLFFGLSKNDLLRMAEILVLSIVAILVILLVVRPLLARAFEAMPSAQAAAQALLEEQKPKLAAPGVPMPSEISEEPEFDEMIDLDRVEGRVRASSVKKVGEIVDKHPGEALSIVRNWMYQDAS